MTNLLNKSAYAYDLPEELIAQTPLEPRDSARLLCFNKETGKITHEVFRDITKYLRKGDVLVINRTKVLPARLFGLKSTGAKIEFLLQKRLGLKNWLVIARPFKRLEAGMVVVISDELRAKIVHKGDYGECEVEFIFNGHFEEVLDRTGTVPLPPYIKANLINKERYQTVYAKEKGSSAAPTAGMHFTQELLKKIQNIGCIISEVILHIGLGTFRPVKEDNILKHKIHSEYFELSKASAEIINKAKSEGRRVIAVGTTSVRVLESAALESGKVKAKCAETNIFIYPSYEFRVTDGLITNFHLPESTLIMLVAAFIGHENTMKVYEEAVAKRYRFFSFGDACLFL